MEKQKMKKLSKEIIILLIIWCVVLGMMLLSKAVKVLTNNVKGLDYQLITGRPSEEISSSGNGKYEILKDYKDYEKLINRHSDNVYKAEMKYTEETFEDKNLLVVYFFVSDFSPHYINLVDFDENDDIVKLKFSEKEGAGCYVYREKTMYIIPVSKSVNSVYMAYPYCTSVNYELMIAVGIVVSVLSLVISAIIELIHRKGSWKKRIITSISIVLVIIILIVLYVLYQGRTIIYDSYKPIIYLYPTENMDISVKLGNPGKLTCSYPKYINGWNVNADVDGSLIDIDTNKNLYALYYENENILRFEVEEEGFVVKGEDSAKFLEEKLEILGLNDKEKEEFIIYWLPKLESNNYNYIRFATEEEININMPLEINPKPDTVIRILMTYKGLNKSINVISQQLEKVERNGYTVVEWGGTEIK